MAKTTKSRFPKNPGKGRPVQNVAASLLRAMEQPASQRALLAALDPTSGGKQPRRNTGPTSKG